jgi:hypothetical protein
MGRGTNNCPAFTILGIVRFLAIILPIMMHLGNTQVDLAYILIIDD